MFKLEEDLLKKYAQVMVHYALNNGQAFVSVDDIRSVAMPALRHRILLNFEGEADEVNTDTIVTELLDQVAA